MRSLLAFLLALCALSAYPGSSAAVSVWPLSPGERLHPAMTAGRSAAVVIHAAQGEREGALVGVRGTGVRPVAITAPTGPGGTRLGIDAFRVGWVTLTRPSDGGGDPTLLGRQGDPLVPLGDSVDLGRGGEATGLYLRADVPPGAPAGRYRGEVVVGPSRVAVVVEVAPVRIDVETFPLAIRLSVGDLARAHGVAPDDPALLEGVRTRLIPELRRQRVAPSIQATPHLTPAPWGEVIITGDAAAQAAQARAASPGSTLFTIPLDEPTDDEWGAVRERAEHVRAQAPGVRTMVTAAPGAPAIAAAGDVIDIWTVPMWEWWAHADALRALRERGRGTWWYLYGSQAGTGLPSLHIDRPQDEPRLIGWLAAATGAQGFLYWSLDDWSPVGEPAQDPWITPWRRSHIRTRPGCPTREIGGNGEASLIYPAGTTADPAIGSLRLESLRDGAEDHALLQRLAGRHPALYDRLRQGLLRTRDGVAADYAPCLPAPDAARPEIAVGPGDLHAARRTALGAFTGTLRTVTGRVRDGRGLVGTAWVRAGASEVRTAPDGRFRLERVPMGVTVRVSRDRAGRIDAVRATARPRMDVTLPGVRVAIPVTRMRATGRGARLQSGRLRLVRSYDSRGRARQQGVGWVTLGALPAGHDLELALNVRVRGPHPVRLTLRTEGRPVPVAVATGTTRVRIPRARIPGSGRTAPLVIGMTIPRAPRARAGDTAAVDLTIRGADAVLPPRRG